MNIGLLITVGAFILGYMRWTKTGRIGQVIAVAIGAIILIMITDYSFLQTIANSLKAVVQDAVTAFLNSLSGGGGPKKV